MSTICWERCTMRRCARRHQHAPGSSQLCPCCSSGWITQSLPRTTWRFHTPQALWIPLQQGPALLLPLAWAGALRTSAAATAKSAGWHFSSGRTVIPSGQLVRWRLVVTGGWEGTGNGTIPKGPHGPHDIGISNLAPCLKFHQAQGGKFSPSKEKQDELPSNSSMVWVLR